MSVDCGRFSAVLLEGLKELARKVENQKEKITELTKMVNDLKARVVELEQKLSEK